MQHGDFGGAFSAAPAVRHLSLLLEALVVPEGLSPRPGDLAGGAGDLGAAAHGLGSLRAGDVRTQAGKKKIVAASRGVGGGILQGLAKFPVCLSVKVHFPLPCEKFSTIFKEAPRKNNILATLTLSV